VAPDVHVRFEIRLEELSELAAHLPGAVEEQPFGPDVDVMKVGGKIFAILSPGSDPEAISLKCEPGLALELRARYDAVIPGYHLNKRLWNTVHLDGSIPSREVREMLMHSYEQVVAGLSKSVRSSLN
jgi:predicted DNA-binding protein (MmcQ/YjbR family)